MSQHGCPERLSNRSKGFQEDGQSQPTMEVLVETLTGTAFEMTVSPSDTIFAIKSKIFRVEGIPVSQQHLLYNLKELEDSSSLHEHAISDGARLRLVLGMCGGPITTRRLPPPQNEPWRDIERLLDSNRDDGEWGGNGCKVTVLVFREGERVNMLRVRENRDGSYSPLDHNKCEGDTLPVHTTHGNIGALRLVWTGRESPLPLSNDVKFFPDFRVISKIYPKKENGKKCIGCAIELATPVRSRIFKIQDGGQTSGHFIRKIGYRHHVEPILTHLATFVRLLPGKQFLGK
ncbi:unnamed protein product [Diatraea saccharalis]|uniref:Ubiquitin-like domain-containing protein n=1 Tax=Diatraea saccharalis TaxID=40085 RepID=A0A9N9WFA7_9NEOP|nr:unnamed protein product [Diatraea saccharalis]